MNNIGMWSGRTTGVVGSASVQLEALVALVSRLGRAEPLL
jgi:hypothetical protein